MPTTPRRTQRQEDGQRFESRMHVKSVCQMSHQRDEDQVEDNSIQ